MTSDGFAYYRPDSLEEALAIWAELEGAGIYYSGGTEIVTGMRTGAYELRAAIDVKAVPECRERGLRGDALYFGSALALNAVADDPSFPLLAEAARGVADRTVRNRLTLGGNCVGRLPYREALLPFLAVDGTAHLAGPDGRGGAALREIALSALHAKRLALAPGELLVGLSVSREAVGLPCFHGRATRGPSVDYPLVSLCVVASGEGFSAAVSGVHDHPIRIETAGRFPVRADFPPPKADWRASAEYRAALLERELGLAREALS